MSFKEKLVCVEWDDASYDSGYYDEEDTKKLEPISVKTIGHLVKSDKKVIVLAMDSINRGDSSDMRHTSTIPKKMITKTRYLRDK